MNLIKWLLFGPHLVLRMGGDDGGGDGGAGAREEEEQARKDTLRKRIDALYGVGGTKPIVRQNVRFVDNGNGEAQWQDRIVEDEIVGYEDDPAAVAARAQMQAEETELAKATRGYYADQLGKDYEKAERNTRFKLARQGLLGGSEDVSQQAEVKSDRDLGATRVDEAVRRAISGLRGQREQERLNAINLVNSGAGDSAVSAAAAGLRNSFDAAASAQRADLFSDLFSNTADALTANNLNAQNAALLDRYRNRLATFFPANSTTSGRVTPTG